MNWFPQNTAGSVAQFPLERTRTWRAIRNVLESGEQIVLPDAAGGQIGWQLSYVDLSDAETAQISDLFNASSGSYGSFGFVDPAANLLNWSEDLSQPDWQTGSLTTQSGVADPLGSTRAWSLTNGAAGPLALTQTVAIPGTYVACFSVWIRSDIVGAVSLHRDAVSSIVQAGPQWQRFYVSGAGPVGATNANVSIVVAPEQTIQVFGMQFEAQPYPSQYKPTTVSAGIYEETYFGTDELTITSTGVGLSACDITLISRV